MRCATKILVRGTGAFMGKVTIGWCAPPTKRKNGRFCPSFRQMNESLSASSASFWFFGSRHEASTTSKVSSTSSPMLSVTMVMTSFPVAGKPQSSNSPSTGVFIPQNTRGISVQHPSGDCGVRRRISTLSLQVQSPPFFVSAERRKWLSSICHRPCELVLIWGG